MIDKNVYQVRRKILLRSAIGINKYGTTTETADLTAIDWLTHLQEELMDACVYIEAFLGKENVSSHQDRSDGGTEEV
jgi:hypothetical protein